MASHTQRKSLERKLIALKKQKNKKKKEDEGAKIIYFNFFQYLKFFMTIIIILLLNCFRFDKFQKSIIHPLAKFKALL